MRNHAAIALGVALAGGCAEVLDLGALTETEGGVEASTNDSGDGGGAGTGSVMACSISPLCSSPGVIAANQNAPIAIAVNASGVYWLNEGTYTDAGAINNDGELHLCVPPGAGCIDKTLAASLDNPSTIAVDGSGANVYWGTASGVYTCGTAGSVVVRQVAVDTNIPTGIAVDAANVYWVSLFGTALYKCPIGMVCGTTPSTLVTGLNGPNALGIDGCNLYWVEESPFATGAMGTVKQCSPANCQPVPLATAQNQPSAIALDSTSVYWTNWGDGHVMSLTPK